MSSQGYSHISIMGPQNVVLIHTRDYPRDEFRECFQGKLDVAYFREGIAIRGIRSQLADVCLSILNPCAKREHTGL